MADPEEIENQEGVESKHEHGEGTPERIRDLEHRPESSTAHGSEADGAGSGTAPQGHAREVSPGDQALPGFESTDQFVAQYARFQYSGPLLPEQLQGFEALVPGSAKEIVHAQIIGPEKRLDDLARGEIYTAKTGQGWAIFLAVVCIVAAIVFFALGNNIAGGALLGLPLVGLIGSFLPRWTKRQD